MQRVPLFTPNGRALRAYTDLSTTGGGLHAVLLPVAAMLGFSARGGRRWPPSGPAGGRDVSVPRHPLASAPPGCPRPPALFFMIILPVMVILILGATFAASPPFRIGVVDLGAGQAGRRPHRRLAPALPA